MEDFAQYRKEHRQQYIILKRPQTTLKIKRYNTNSSNQNNNQSIDSTIVNRTKKTSFYFPKPLKKSQSQNLHVSPNSKEHINKISNFFDKEQIKENFHLLPTLKNRLDFIDAVVKRRGEIKEIDEQTRFERMTPVLYKVGEKLRQSVRTKTAAVNHFRKATRQLSDSNFKDFVVQSISESETSSFSPMLKSEERPRLSSSFFKGAQQPTEMSKLTLDETETDKTESFMNISKNNSSLGLMHKRTSRILAILTQKLKNKEKTPNELVFGDEVDTTKGDFSNAIAKLTSRSDRDNAQENPSVKKKGFENKMHNLAADVLEKDIFKFLVKSGKKTEAQRIVLGFEEPKEPRIRQIEKKAKVKFIKFFENKSNEQSSLSGLKMTRKDLEQRKEKIEFCGLKTYGTLSKLQNPSDLKQNSFHILQNSFLLRNFNDKKLTNKDISIENIKKTGPEKKKRQDNFISIRMPKQITKARYEMAERRKEKSLL